MGNEHLFFYIESMVVCVIIFVILLVHDLIQGDRQERKFRFDNVLLANIFYFICDSFWAMIICGVIPQTPFSVLTVNFLLLVFLALVGYTWFTFTAAMTEMPRRASKRGRMLIAAPLFLVTVIMLVSLFVDPYRWLTEDLNTVDGFYVLFLIAPLIYVFCSFLYAIYQATKKENRLNRRLFLVLGFYPLTVVAAGLVETLWIDVPIFCYSSTIMIILFNLIFMEQQISVDPLTHLNNRGQIMRFTSQDASLHKDDLQTYVVIADVNSFKAINDTYGHVEGDQALTLVADALRRAAERAEYPPFLGRYGGDEFVLLVYVHPQKEGGSEVKNMLETIEWDLAQCCRLNNKPYIISLSFGFEEIGKDDDFQDCMQRADKKLYEDKARRKAVRTPKVS